jgi:sugar lactone lactonase YvrE
VAVDTSGNLYIADIYNDAIREVTASNGIINTIAGIGPTAGCFSLGGDGGPAADAALCFPQGVSLDTAGNLYIAESGYNRIRVATAAALPPTATTAAPTITVAAGTYTAPQTVSISDSTPGASIYLTTDGTTPSPVGVGYNGPIDVSGSATIKAIAVAQGHLASAPVSAGYTITSAPTKVIQTVAGTGVSGQSGAGGPATSAQLGQLAAMAVDKAGDLFFTDTTNNIVWMVSAADGKISIVAGNGTPGYSGDGGAATSAQLYYPLGVAVDSAGGLYIADSANDVVRKVDPNTGLIETVAGIHNHFGGSVGQIGDGGPATAAYLNYPQGLAIDAADNLYIADSQNNEVRMVSASTGIITSVAGNGNYGFSGEGGPATSAALQQPNTLAFDSKGNLYVGSYNLSRVLKVAKTTGTLTIAAGNGNLGGSGDGGKATNAEIFPFGIALDAADNLYISNPPGVIREVSAGTGVITKVVGTGYPGYSGDGGSATIAQISYPEGIAFDASGNLYIADLGDSRVREVSTPAPAATPIISPVAGIYTSVQMATITDSTKGAIIYYTTDGTAPTNSSSVYDGPITISTTTTLQAIAIASGFGQSAVATSTYTIHLPIAPAVTATPTATSITTEQALTVMVKVAGPNGSPTPTGSVTLSGGGYNSAATALTKGSATFSLAPGALAVGTDTLTASYTPDAGSISAYTGATGETPAITVTQAIGTAEATVTLTPSAAILTNEQPLKVAVSVAEASG